MNVNIKNPTSPNENITKQKEPDTKSSKMKGEKDGTLLQPTPNIFIFHTRTKFLILLIFSCYGFNRDFFKSIEITRNIYANSFPKTLRTRTHPKRHTFIPIIYY